MLLNIITPSNLPESSIEFRNIFDSYLDLCEFKEEEKLGILFYLGSFIPEKLTNIDPNSSNYRQYLQVLTLYSKSSGQFSDYSDLNDVVLSRWLYNANLAISKITGEEIDIDSHLRKLPFSEIIIGKMDPIDGFLDLFEEKSFSLNAIQNFNDEIFIQTGKHLKDNNYTHTRAYEAGFAFRMMLLEMDIKGTTFLFSRMSAHMTPLFEALFYTPFLFVFNQKAVRSSHFISMILNSLYGGQESHLYPIIEPIHRYHQILFYKENSYEIRDEWLFNKKTEKGSAALIFLNALKISKTKLKEMGERIKESGEVYESGLIDAKIDLDDFLNTILKVIQSKYSINGYTEFIEENEGRWNTIWNNKGDYIQFLVILFYETCLHALIVEEIK